MNYNNKITDYASEMKKYITHNASIGSDRRNNRFDLIDGLFTSDDGHVNIEELIFKENDIMETIEVRGVEYKLVKARDFEVIVRSDNSFINYTRLCQQINGGKKPFYNIKVNEDFKRICIQMENSSPGIPGDENKASLYEQIKDRIEITITGGKEGSELEKLRGTYMPRYLLDYVIMTCDISYYKLIHELMDSIDQVAQERQRSFIEELQSNISEQNRKLERKRAKITRLDQLCNELRESNSRIEAQNNQLLEENREQRETIDELYNMNLSSGVTIRSLDKKVNNLVDVGRAIHNQISTIKVKDIKQHKTNDVLILYTSSEKPRDNELRGHTPEGMIWISSFNGQRLNFQPPHIPRDRVVIFESHSNRLDSFKLLLDKPNVARFIRNKTQYRDILIRIDQQDEFLQVIQKELERDDNYPVVNDLEVATLDVVTNEEIAFKRNLLQQHSPLLINLNRYKRRLYANVNNELVLVEEIENPEQYTWMYRYGPNGSKFGKLDLDMLKTSRFTNELETRINYE